MSTPREPADLLSPLELEAMDALGKAAGLMHRVIGEGPQAQHDWAEAADKIHQLQSMVLSQAVVRAYPHMFRPLGGRIGEDAIGDEA